MMNFMSKIMDAFHKEYGEDAKFEEGEKQVFVLNDCTVIVGIDEERKLKVEVLGDKPINVDYTTGLYGDSEV